MLAHTPPPADTPAVWSFPENHAFTIDDRPHRFVGSDALLFRCCPDDTGIQQDIPQFEFDALVRAGRIDPCLDENDPAAVAIKLRHPDVVTMSDLPAEEQEQLVFYTRLCRTLCEKYARREVSYTDKSLRMAIPKVMADLRASGLDPTLRRYDGQNRGAKQPGGSKKKHVSARKTAAVHAEPAPSTVRDWIHKLCAARWDPMAIRDGRKGRHCPTGARITDPVANDILLSWAHKYIDRSRPTQANLYRLMVGGPDLSEEATSGRRPIAAHILRSNLPTFHSENARRAQEGLPELPIPSLATFRRRIRALPKYDVALGRFGPTTAKKGFKVSGRRETATRPGEVVEIDSWRLQKFSKVVPAKEFEGLPVDVAKVIKNIRFALTVALDGATRYPLGAQLSFNPNADTTLQCIRMICVDKSDISKAAGCRSRWSASCSPFSIAADGGPENTAATVHAAIRDIGANYAVGRGGFPDERGGLERFFRTTDLGLLSLFQGRTFSSVGDRGDYKAEELANLMLPVLQKALTRYLVDVYPNQPHAGLGGLTPVDAWIEGTKMYGIIPPPSRDRLRAAFGFTTTRRIQNYGLRVVGAEYVSEELAELRRRIGQAEVLVRIDLQDLDHASVRYDAPGEPWIRVPCRTPLAGVSIQEWFATAAELRRRHADTSALREAVVLSALADIRRMGVQSALDVGLGPSTMSSMDIEDHAAALFAHFRIVEPAERGRAVGFLDDAMTSVPEEVPSDLTRTELPKGDEPKAFSTRRGSRRPFSIKGDE